MTYGDLSGLVLKKIWKQGSVEEFDRAFDELLCEFLNRWATMRMTGGQIKDPFE